MSLQILKDHLARELETLDTEGGRNWFVASDGNSDCTIQVELTRGTLAVVMNYDDAMPFDASRGRMTVQNHPIRLRIRKPNGGSEMFPVSRAGRSRSGEQLLEYKARDENPELLRIVILMVAIFKKAAERAA